MDVILGLVAEAANITDEDRINVLGIFHRIVAQELPIQIPHMAAAIELRLNPFEKGRAFVLALFLLDPDGKSACSIEGLEFGVTDDEPVLRPIIPVVLGLDGVVFTQAGDYRYEIRINGQVAGEIALEIIDGRAPELNGPTTRS